MIRKEMADLNALWSDKGFAKHNCVLNVIDITLCNVKDKSRHNSKGVYRDFGISHEIQETDIDEYKEMFRELFEVIKKHNRKWSGDNENL